jgi:hypothetical protein
MSLAIALYAGEISFTQLVRNEQQNKAMLDSWVMSERTYQSPQTENYSYGTSFDQVGMMQIDSSPYAKSSSNGIPAKEQYNQYSWLFGTNKKA